MDGYTWNFDTDNCTINIFLNGRFWGAISRIIDGESRSMPSLKKLKELLPKQVIAAIEEELMNHVKK
jgi:hypothetical protein